VVYKIIAMPELPLEFRNDLNKLSGKIKSAMMQVHDKYNSAGKIISDEEFQDEVISRLEISINNNFLDKLNRDAPVWTDNRSSILKHYFENRLKGIKPQRHIKVAFKCNSEGGTEEVLQKDLEPWLNQLYNFVKNPENKKYLSAASTRKRAILTLQAMMKFPVSVKETPVDHFLSEEETESFLINAPEKFLPAGALIAMSNGQHRQDLLLATANVRDYFIGEDEYRLEGRVKGLSEALKLAKNAVGIRKKNDPHFDGIGGIEVVPGLGHVVDMLNRVNATKNKKKYFKTEHRYNLIEEDPLKEIGFNEFGRLPAKDEIKKIQERSENAIMNLLKISYLDKNGEVDSRIADKFRNDLIYGTWIDFNLKSTKGPIEVQIKDRFAYHLYTFNSPFGHNSKAYSKIRENQIDEKIELIPGVFYSANKVANYVANKILLPAFTSISIV